MIGITEVVGALTGLVGSIATSVMKYKMRKLELQDRQNQREHEREMAKIEIESMVKEAEANIKITETLVEGQERIIDAQSYLESQKQAQKQLFSEKFIDWLFSIEGKIGFVAKAIGTLIAFLFAMIDCIKALMRPSITIYQAGITTWFAYRAWGIMQATKGITPEQAVLIFTRVMDVVIYLTVSCVTWWFADRRMEKHLIAYLDRK